MRSKNYLDLRLQPTFWKWLVGESVDEGDLRDIDEVLHNQLRGIRHQVAATSNPGRCACCILLSGCVCLCARVVEVGGSSRCMLELRDACVEVRSVGVCSDAVATFTVETFDGKLVSECMLSLTAVPKVRDTPASLPCRWMLFLAVSPSR